MEKENNRGRKIIVLIGTIIFQPHFIYRKGNRIKWKKEK